MSDSGSRTDRNGQQGSFPPGGHRQVSAPLLTTAEPRKSLSAGSLSLAFHVIAFLLLALLRPPGGAPSPSGREPDRAVEIVLTRVNPSPVDRYLDSREDVPHPAAAAQGGADHAVAEPSLPAAESLIPDELALPTPVATLPTHRLGDATGTAGTGPTRPSARVPAAGDVEAYLNAERARLAAGKPQGDAVSLSLFGGGSSSGRSFVFLIDRSKSMGSEGLGALAAAEEELLLALEPLQPVHRFQVIAYHHQCVYLQRRELLPANAENKAAVRGYLSGLAAFGATEHELALQSALHHKPDVIYLLTDGGDPELSEPQIRRVTRLAAGMTTIHCVQFGFGPQQSDSPFLSRLAMLNGGSYTYVDMNAVAQSLRD